MRVALEARMTKINSFRDLTVWQVSMDLADVPAGISIPSNIAEGSRRPSLGSHGEVETLFEVIHRRKLVADPLLAKGVVLIEPIGKMLHGLEESLEARLRANA